MTHGCQRPARRALRLDCVDYGTSSQVFSNGERENVLRRVDVGRGRVAAGHATEFRPSSAVAIALVLRAALVACLARVPRRNRDQVRSLAFQHPLQRRPPGVADATVDPGLVCSENQKGTGRWLSSTKFAPCSRFPEAAAAHDPRTLRHHSRGRLVRCRVPAGGTDLTGGLVTHIGPLPCTVGTRSGIPDGASRESEGRVRPPQASPARRRDASRNACTWNAPFRLKDGFAGRRLRLLGHRTEHCHLMFDILAATIDVHLRFAA